MTIRHLRIFVTVSDCGSITEAAKKLYVSQPSISVAIKNMEEYYGIKLFDRMPKKLVITEAGRQLLEQARHITSLYDKMEEGAKNWDSFGVLKVGSSITIGNFLMPDYVEKMQKRHEGIKVQVTINSSEKIINMILDNQLDIALIEGIPNDKRLKKIPFMDDDLIVICHSNHPLLKEEKVTINDIIENDFILREKGSGTREIFESAMLLKEIVINPIWECVSTQAIVKAVKLGFGISVLPKRLIESDLKEGCIAKLSVEDLELSRKFYIIYHVNKFLTEAAREFMEICEN